MTNDITKKTIASMYRNMVRIRHFEERVAELLEVGDITCPTHLYIGQEAVAAGVCEPLSPEDSIFGNHRSHGHYLAKGGDMSAMMAELFGKATGCSKGRGGSMHLFAPAVGVIGTVPIVSGTVPLAVGAALASSLRHEKRVSVAFFGDGAMEEGAVHESMNLASSRKLPVLFICENNFYSSHLQILERRAKNNILASAEAHGMAGVTVDGNDAEEVYRETSSAIVQAKAGQGPTLLECITYRWRGHVGPAWDEDVGVKRRDELGEWLNKDPNKRMREKLSQMGTTEAELTEIEDASLQEVKEAERFARQAPYPDKKDLMDNVFVDTATWAR